MLSDYIQTIEIQPPQQLCRIHIAGLEPLYFGTKPVREELSRFDSPLPVKVYGVCYLAYTPLGSFLEVFARSGQSTFDISGYELSTIEVTKTITVMNLPDPEHLGKLRVESSHYLGSDYSDSQQISLLAHHCRLDGINTILRHTLELQLRGLAFFGLDGDPVTSLKVINTTEIPASVVEEAERIFRTDLIRSDRPEDFAGISELIYRELDVDMDTRTLPHTYYDSFV